MSQWDHLKKFTSARVGLGRAGHAQPTQVVLAFQRAHAEARNAVLKSWDRTELLKKLDDAISISTQAMNREDYLKFPNKGRTLSSQSRDTLATITGELNSAPTVVFIISDGLSANAIDKHLLNFWPHFIETFEKNFPKLRYQIVLAPFGRVALSDEIGELLKAKLAVIFIGERPGLNSSDSLGIYLTYDPKPGNSDAQRNCISNVRPPEGLSYEVAALKLNYLIQESLRRQLSGVHLKDECFISSEANLSLVETKNICTPK